MRSANPALRNFDQPQTWEAAFGRPSLAEARPNTMTVRGTVTATSILLGICAAAAIGSWAAATSQGYQHLTWPLGLGGLIGGLVLGLIITFVPRTAQFLSPLYAACEGLFLGVFSFVVGQQVSAKVGQDVGSALVLQAVGLTIAIAAAMLFGYATRIIRPGKVFRACVLSAGMGLGLFALVAIVMALLGNSTLISVYSSTNSSMISIGFSLFVVVIASLFLVLDFEFIEHGVQSGMPKHMEWYGGFALLVTLVWLYIELLRLLAKLRSSD
jgi:uncharacterized YccA/Bax inhibitor family protein